LNLQEIPESDLVLVALVPNQRDLDIARLLGWYRVPLKSSPKVISVDYIAFYQGGAYPVDQRWQIRYIAPVLGHELRTRAELLQDQPDHPRASEEYFKIVLGPLIELDHPIPAGNWRRVLFFYTTAGRLCSAEELADLPVHDEERDVLWHALRERALLANEYRATELPQAALDPAILALLSGLKRQG
jgi:hypothetical protein